MHVVNLKWIIFLLQLEAIDKMPTLTELVQQLYDPDVYQKIGLVIDLLHWLLVELKDIQIKSVPKSEVMPVEWYSVWYQQHDSWEGDSANLGCLWELVSCSLRVQ
jgi:hypothetical protein